jgi:hypothetical protein
MSKSLLFLAAIVAIIVGIYLSQSGFGNGNEKYQNPIDIVSKSTSLDIELRKHKPLIGSDYAGYRNHIMRVLTYTKHFLCK